MKGYRRLLVIAACMTVGAFKLNDTQYLELLQYVVLCFCGSDAAEKLSIGVRQTASRIRERRDRRREDALRDELRSRVPDAYRPDGGAA